MLCHYLFTHLCGGGGADMKQRKAEADSDILHDARAVRHERMHRMASSMFSVDHKVNVHG